MRGGNSSMPRLKRGFCAAAAAAAVVVVAAAVAVAVVVVDVVLETPTMGLVTFYFPRLLLFNTNEYVSRSLSLSHFLSFFLLGTDTCNKFMTSFFAFAFIIFVSMFLSHPYYLSLIHSIYRSMELILSHYLSLPIFLSELYLLFLFSFSRFNIYPSPFLTFFYSLFLTNFVSVFVSLSFLMFSLFTFSFLLHMNTNALSLPHLFSLTLSHTPFSHTRKHFLILSHSSIPIQTDCVVGMRRC